jgi:hypothetical protein
MTAKLRRYEIEAGLYMELIRDIGENLEQGLAL